jgi:hypothetical protein
MKVRTQVSVSGFTEAQATEGLEDLRAELTARPWLEDARVHWDRPRERLVVAVTREGESPDIHGGDGGANYDEISDCIWACYRFPEPGLEFHIDESHVSDPREHGAA